MPSVRGQDQWVLWNNLRGRCRRQTREMTIGAISRQGTKETSDRPGSKYNLLTRVRRNLTNWNVLLEMGIPSLSCRAKLCPEKSAKWRKRWKKPFGGFRGFKIILTLKTECATLTLEETFRFCCCRDLSWKSCKNSRRGVVERVMGTQSIRPRSLYIHCLETTLGHCRWNILKVILSLYVILYNNHIHFTLINHIIL